MKNALVLLGLSVGLISCNQTAKESETAPYLVKKSIEISPTKPVENDGYALMKENCYVCHNPEAVSHDAIIAPPFKAVKMHYTKNYDTKEEFVNAMVNWVQNPSEEKALMAGAVTEFKVMPPLPLETSELEKIATYIYENDVEEPVWMNEHMKEMKGNGMRNGKGKRKGMRKVNQLK